MHHNIVKCNILVVLWFDLVRTFNIITFYTAVVKFCGYIIKLPIWLLCNTISVPLYIKKFDKNLK